MEKLSCLECKKASPREHGTNRLLSSARSVSWLYERVALVRCRGRDPTLETAMKTLGIALFGAAVWTSIVRPIICRTYKYIKEMQERTNFLRT